jgi:hypothetical protein
MLGSNTAVGSAEPVPAGAPREQLLFDNGWKFKFGHGTDPSKDMGFGFGQAQFAHMGIFAVAKARFDDSDWRTLNLPHDWAVELPFVHDDAGTGDNPLRSHGYKPLGRRYPETSVGWYRREFEIPASDVGRRIWVEFDGAFRDTIAFVNGCYIGRSNSGYVPFRFDVTDFLAYGATNYIALRVDASMGDGWWYEGAGIYRHLWLTKTDAVHLGRWESTVRSTVNGKSATLALATGVQNEGQDAANAKVSWKIVDASGATVATAESPRQAIPADGYSEFSATSRLANPALWSVDAPNLYSAVVTVETDGKVRDAERITFGVRTAVFDPDKGFLLNGKPLKIQGTANHQDHAGVGSAIPDRLQWFRLAVLREMGSNAVRTSHNMPTPEWVDACDRMGMMMMCETRQMSSSAEGLAQLEVMVKRYRNSPSIIIWSIGNEEGQFQNQMAEQGARVAASMVRLCHRLDPTRVVSYADNGDNEKGPSLALDIIGFNYGAQRIEPFHQKYPKRAIYGSETASDVSTRGVYTTDRLRNTADSYTGGGRGNNGAPEGWWGFYGSAVDQTAQNVDGWLVKSIVSVANLNQPGTVTSPATQTTAENPLVGFVGNYPSATPFTGVAGSFNTPPQFTAPHSDQWTVGFQQKFGAQGVWTLNYVGNRGRNIDLGMVANTALPGPGAIAPRTPFPYMGQSHWDVPLNQSDYNALQTSFQGRDKKTGLSYIISYTWSHSLDIGADDWYGSGTGSIEHPYDLRLDRSNSGFDLRNVFTAGWTWTIPVGSGSNIHNRYERARLCSWKLETEWNHVVRHWPAIQSLSERRHR